MIHILLCYKVNEKNADDDSRKRWSMSAEVWRMEDGAWRTEVMEKERDKKTRLRRLDIEENDCRLLKMINEGRRWWRERGKRGDGE